MPVPRVRVRVAITPKLRAALAELRRLPTASDEIAALVIRAASIPVDRARAIVPVRTGQLRSALFVDRRQPFRDVRGISVLAGISVRRAPHWHLVERGTRRMRARPYWFPTLQSSIADMRRTIREGIYALVARLNRRD